MTTTPKNLIPMKYVENSQTTQYTATLVTTIISAFSVTNTSASNATFSLNLVASGGSAGATNLKIQAKTIVPGETYICSEIFGEVIEKGGFISTIASAASALTMSASGYEST